MKYIIKLILTGVIVFTEIVHAGIEVGGTRQVFNSSDNESNISVKNTDKDKPYLIQSWVDLPEGQEGKVPFIVTPPLFRLDGEQQNILRILKTDGELPTDKESLFWLNIKAIPSVAENTKGKNILQFSVKNRMKLFYRPEGLESTPEKAMSDVSWKSNGNKLIANNKTGYFVNLSAVSLDGVKIPIDYTNSLVPPQSQTTFNVNPSTTAGSTVTWKALNDYGAVSQLFSTKVQ